MMEDQHEVLRPTQDLPKWLSYAVPTVSMPELAPPGGSIIEVFPPIDQHRLVEDWKTSNRAQSPTPRSRHYRAFTGSTSR